MKEKPKVVYSIGAQFAAPCGVGYTAYTAVRWGAFKSGYLSKLICQSYIKSEVPKEKIISFPWLRYLILPFRAVQMIFKWDWICPFPYSDKLYSWLAAKKVSNGNILHSWMGYSKLAIREAKKRGMISIVECASSHPALQREILKEEYSKFPTDSTVATDEQINRLDTELREADYITIPSDFVEQSFIERGFPKEKLIKIPFGADINKYSTLKKKRSNKFTVIFVGAIHFRKGLHYLLQAWRDLNLKNAELIVVGRIWPDIHKALEPYKKIPGVKWVGFAKPKEYYQQGDIFVCPSLEEGSAGVTYEAMASGLPVVTTFNSGSIVRDGKDGFIIPIRNVEAIKKKILYFYNNPQQIKKMGQSARKYVEKFTWEDYGAKLSKAYEKVLEKRR
jgi:glycosyltransferase involved in cell wall biosynthesis